MPSHTDRRINVYKKRGKSLMGFGGIWCNLQLVQTVRQALWRSQQRSMGLEKGVRKSNPGLRQDFGYEERREDVGVGGGKLKFFNVG